MERSIRYVLVVLAVSAAAPGLAMTHAPESAPPAKTQPQTPAAPATAATATPKDVQVTPLPSLPEHGKVLGQQAAPRE